MIDQAMLMAAGLGTRMRPLTNQMPKPFLPILSTSPIQLWLDRLANQGIKRVVVNIHHLPALSRKLIGQLETHGMEIIISDESKKLLGSAGGIREALEHFKNKPFWLINTDTLCACSLQDIAQKYELQKTKEPEGEVVAPKMLMLLRKNPGIEAYREIFFKKNQIVGTGSVTKKNWYYAGVGILEPDVVNHLRQGEVQDFFESIFEPAVQKKWIMAAFFSGFWIDLGGPMHYLQGHIELIKLIQSKSKKIPPEWCKRWLAENVFIKKGVMASKRFLFSRLSKNELNSIKAPSYIGDLKHLPKVVGPRAVLYPPLNEDKKIYVKGLGFGGHWLTF